MVSLLTFLSRVIRFTCAFACVQAPLFAQSQSKNEKNKSVSRVAEIKHVNSVNDSRLRVIFSAQERDGDLRFPITTIDRSMVRVEFTNSATAPIEPKSLLLHGQGGAELHRALYVGFALHRHLNGNGVMELKSQIGDVIKALPAEYMTLAAVSQDSGRIIADVNPEKGDNINRIIQQLQSLEPEGEGPSLTDTLCVASERFSAWNLSKFTKGDQKVLIIYTSPGDAQSTERYRAENCWRSLIDQGVRVYVIAFGKPFGGQVIDLASTALESGGHYHRVNGPVEMYAATKNLIANLNNEYAIEFDTPEIALEDQPLEVKVKISYHSEVFESPVFNVGFFMPSLTKAFVKSDPVDPRTGPNKEDSGGMIDWVGLVPIFLIILMGVILVAWSVRVIRRHSHTVSCQTCSSRVALDHSDCPFRKSETVARFVVVGGKNAGQTIPVRKGETVIGRYPNSGVRISGRGIAWFNHGVVRLDGQKAIYSPAKSGRDRINGWIVNEPRLLGVGSLLCVGDQKLRFEVKPQVHT